MPPKRPPPNTPLTPAPRSPSDSTCEYTPCKTGPNKDPRKVISHIFGRNKTLTKLIPNHVWVHYCRQHYQRARYRARDWPIRQCELLLVSLRRMQEWGRIRGFLLLLRRREGVRVGTGTGTATDVQEEAGPGVRGRVVTRSLARSRALSVSVSAEKKAADVPAAAMTPVSTPKKQSPKQPRRKPTILASPVPAWLRGEADPVAVRTFDDIRCIVDRLKGGFERQRGGESGSVEVAKFPDIEILPVFYEDVKVGRGRRRGGK